MLNVNRDFIILLFGRLAQILITLVSLRVSTTMMADSELGLVYFVIAIQAFFVFSFISPVGQYFNRQTNSWFVSGVLKKYLFNHSLYVFLVALVAFLFLILARELGFLDLSVYLIFIVSCLILFQSLNQTIIPMFNMIENRYAFVIFSLLTAGFSAFFSWLLLFYWNNVASSWLMGVVFGNLIVNLSAFLWMNLYVKEIEKTVQQRSNNINRVVAFALPIALSTLFMWFLGSGYRILIEHTYGLSFLAALGVGFAVSGQLFATAESLLTQYLTPALYRNVSNTSKHKRMTYLNKYISVAVPTYISLAIFLTFSVKYIFPFLVADKYHEY